MDLYEEMQKFYKEFYSANGMTLSVIGKESIQELEARLRYAFGRDHDIKTSSFLLRQTWIHWKCKKDIN